MSAFEFRHEGRQPLIPVFVGARHYLGQFNLIEATALIDTGSTTTLVSMTVVERLGLEPLGKRQVLGVHGFANKNEFRFRLGLRLQDDGGADPRPYFFPHEVLGAEFVQASRFDMILGMDLIALGALTIRSNGTGVFKL